MIIALAIYLLAHTGVLVAPPVVVNVLAIGSIAENGVSYQNGHTPFTLTKKLTHLGQ